MESIILLKGNVKHPLTLDPGVWIFDDRKVDLHTYFQESKKEEDANEKYTKEVSKHWDREIREGAVFPPTLKTEKKFQKERILTGTFGIPFQPFLENAIPHESAWAVSFVGDDQTVTMSLEEAKEVIFGFSKDGKPLKADGPIHVYKGDGSTLHNPFKNVKEIIIK
ncbi:peptidyl-prolyl cis-trans isomerase [Bacillus sp. CGMCC 1.16541]|uniref:peptidyl-prolyl cis-trans isomerase n=1 Tax=Bacillus sp. CGMCC 1.16541 TaxID=2185143 RepID=UPI000D7397F7|nr:peptidyl-prolyl cis-trans isomerase [Bacillus sp. CGMCC 1.16541]